MDSKLESMHPAWFASGLSSAGVALMLLFDPLQNSSIDQILALAITVLTALLIPTTVGLMVSRFLKYRDAFIADFRHPNFGPLFAAAPAGILVFAIVVGEMMVQELIPTTGFLTLTSALLVIGAIGTLAIGYLFYSHIVDKSDLPLPAMNGSWFIPVVPLILIPNALVRLARLNPTDFPQVQTFTLIGNIALGAGLFLFFLLAAIIGYRLLTQPAPVAHAVATWWIWLAPIGVGGLGIIATSKLHYEAQVAQAASSFGAIFSSMFWGFGIWWMMFALLATLRVRKEIHFHLGLWGFGFPLASFTSLTLQFNREYWVFEFLQNLGSAFALITVVIYFVLLFKTVQAIKTGKAFARA